MAIKATSQGGFENLILGEFRFFISNIMIRSLQNCYLEISNFQNFDFGGILIFISSILLIHNQHFKQISQISNLKFEILKLKKTNFYLPV